MKINRIRCVGCGTILESKTVHDFKQCECDNESFVDGGHDYQRVGGVDLSKIEKWNDDTGIFESLTQPDKIEKEVKLKNTKHKHEWYNFGNIKNNKLYQCLICNVVKKSNIINKDTDFNIDPKTIWNYRQNKPTLIVDDFEQFGVDRKVSHFILLARGVYKWFSVRRKLVKLKNEWKDRVSDTIECIKVAIEDDDNYNKTYFKGYLRALEECRKEIRELCHSDRWQAPDFDKEANNYLKELNNENKNS